MKKYLFLLTLVLISYACQPTNEYSNNSGSDWTLKGFVKVDSLNPILRPDAAQVFNCPLNKRQVFWEARNVLNPSALVKGDSVYLFYRAQDSTGTSRIGLAISEDGLHFKKMPAPVFYPNEDDMKNREWNYLKFQNPVPQLDCKSCYFDGVEDPRIIESEDGRYIMTYTAYDGKTARLALASSTDLRHWTKHGLVFKSEKYQDLWSKSGAIVVRQEGSRMLATKINGRYWMYFGATDLFLASSEDLIQWEVAEDEERQDRISVLTARRGYFDSRLVEPGPFALLNEDGIVLIYNASNAANYNDSELPKFTYAAGQALFDKNQPYKILDRTDSYFIYPNKDYERVGEVNEVCFVEGLVYFNNSWFLYYGTADSKIAVAVSQE